MTCEILIVIWIENEHPNHRSLMTNLTQVFSFFNDKPIRPAAHGQTNSQINTINVDASALFGHARRNDIGFRDNI